MFTTTLTYVTLRLLGVSPEDPVACRMRAWIRENGTPLGAASWGKFVLALLNLYDYEGLHPILPELWLLPPATPIHPSRLWCHCRQVYLPMAYLYGRRARLPAEGLVLRLREELYDIPYDEIPFREHRDTVARGDSYVSPSVLLRAANQALALYEDRHVPSLRHRALEEILDHLDHEDRVTHFIRIGPVNAVLNTLVHYFRNAERESEALHRSFATLDGYLFEGHDGVKMNGYNSTALWDTAFAVQAVLATPLAGRHRPALLRAHDYIRDNQVLEDVPDHERYYRHASRGGWPFSDRLHGWPITDCTSEGLKCALALEHTVDRPVPEGLLQDAVRLILSFQNEDGGWATYERKRGGAWLELLNPSQVFGDIMVDYSYVECTSACIQALGEARRRFPGRFDATISEAVRGGERFLRRQQRPDGSFEGSWGVCFTYGTWFGVWGLRAAGAAPSDAAVRRACDFLRAHQRPDGGWGEHYSSCTERHYVQHKEGQAVNTAWGLLALVRAGQAESEAARLGARFLVDRQEACGDWPRESLCGVFNKTALINYENYRRYFPLWALSLYARAVGGR
jgi:squalene/oxidosqualene cyclase-like protein